MADTLVDHEAQDYDAVLVVSFGGPDGHDDVMPFLDNVVRGVTIPPTVKERIAQRYQHCGGVSPINAATRAFIVALEAELGAHDIALPVYHGNRNWHPLLPDTLKKMQADGIKRAITHVTSVFASYNGCRKYREDLYAATAPLEAAPIIDKLRLGFNHPGFIAAVIDRARATLATLPARREADAALLFTAHSLPESMAALTDYQAQLREACQLVAAGLEQVSAKVGVAVRPAISNYLPDLIEKFDVFLPARLNKRVAKCRVREHELVGNGAEHKCVHRLGDTNDDVGYELVVTDVGRYADREGVECSREDVAKLTGRTLG